MKILYHHRTLGDGAEGIHIREMVRAFRKTGQKVTLASPVNQGSSKSKQTNRMSFVKKLFKRVGLYELLEIGYNIFGLVLLYNAIKKEKPDLIYDRYMIYNAASILAGKLFCIPVVIEVNAPLAFERDKESDETLFLSKIAYKLETVIVNGADKVIVVSTPLKQYLEKMGVNAWKIHVLPNGVNHARFFPAAKKDTLLNQLTIPKRSLVIGFSGILRNWHGLDLLIHAFRHVFEQIPDVHLLLVGDGRIRPELEALAKTLNISDKIRITGRIDHEAMKDYLALFDVAVSPKTTFYASPMKIPEYMAMKKIVVAPNTENIIDLITHGETGLLFKPESATSLAQTIQTALQDLELKKQIVENAFNKTKSELNWKRNADYVVRLLDC